MLGSSWIGWKLYCVKERKERAQDKRFQFENPIFAQILDSHRLPAHSDHIEQFFIIKIFGLSIGHIFLHFLLLSSSIPSIDNPIQYYAKSSFMALAVKFYVGIQSCFILPIQRSAKLFKLNLSHQITLG